MKPVEGNRAILWAALIYAALVLLFTAASLVTSPPESQQGGLRTLSTIPEHVVFLGGFGIVLGLIGSVLYRRLDLNLIVLIPALVLLTDLDHLPVALGMSQPIRPGHSLILLGAVIVTMALLLRRPDIEAAAVSAFFAHLSVDTGLFAPFSPVSFAYYELADYRIAIVTAAIVSALVAGFLGKKRQA